MVAPAKMPAASLLRDGASFLPTFPSFPTFRPVHPAAYRWKRRKLCLQKGRVQNTEVPAP
jgi:hypothetical protein